VKESGPFEFIDICDKKTMYDVCKRYNVDCIVNLAAILSAKGETNPMMAWNINMNGLINVLEIAREMKMKQVMVPVLLLFSDREHLYIVHRRKQCFILLPCMASPRLPAN